MIWMTQLANKKKRRKLWQIFDNMPMFMRSRDWLFFVLFYLVEIYFILTACTSLTWIFRVPFNRKLTSQYVQWKGFSPVWILMCSLNVFWWVKDSSHKSHLYCFSPLCVTICLFNVSPRVKLLEQILQAWGFFLACLIWCSFSFSRLSNNIEQWGHWYFFTFSLVQFPCSLNFFSL